MDALAYWIQKADFSFTEHDPVFLAGAIAAYQAVNWVDEAAKHNPEGDDTCPPGIAFYGPHYQPLIHICPGVNGAAFAHLSIAEPGTLLGFIPWDREKRFFLPSFPNSGSVRLIELFFSGDYDSIRAEFKAEPA